MINSLAKGQIPIFLHRKPRPEGANIPLQRNVSCHRRFPRVRCYLSVTNLLDRVPSLRLFGGFAKYYSRLLRISEHPPKGRLKPSRHHFACRDAKIQPSLRDWDSLRIAPGVETPGYCQLFLRNNGAAPRARIEKRPEASRELRQDHDRKWFGDRGSSMRRAEGGLDSPTGMRRKECQRLFQQRHQRLRARRRHDSYGVGRKACRKAIGAVSQTSPQKGTTAHEKSLWLFAPFCGCQPTD